MADYGNTSSNTALQRTIWSTDMYVDAIDNLYFMRNGMMGKDSNNIVCVKEDLRTETGEKIVFGLKAKMAGLGVTGDGELEGNEEQINYYSEEVLVDQIRFGVRLKGKMDEQESVFNLRTDAKDSLSTCVTEFIERQFFLKLAGVTNTSLVDINGDAYSAYAGFANTPDYIPDADENAGYGSRYLCANAGGTTALSTTDKLTPRLIGRAKTKAMTAKPQVLPLMIKGKEYYVMFVHPWQADDLREHPSFESAQREAQVRGDDNPLFTGALGVWKGVILHEHIYVPFLDISVAGNSFRGTATGTDCAVDCFRALLCGKQAAGYVKIKSIWEEESFDYNNKQGFCAGMMGGIQKMTFNSKEFGVIALDTYATPQQ